MSIEDIDQAGKKVWEVFQKAIKKYDNSMGDFNYLIGRYIYENGDYDEKEFAQKIRSYLREV